MSSESVRFPVEVLSLRIEGDRPPPALANDDVAFVVHTRFNVQLNAGPQTASGHLAGRNRPGSPGYADYWERRVDIFERVCAPSMRHLLPRPHAWYIAFGDMELPCVRSMIERLEAFPWIVPYASAGRTSKDTSLLAEHAKQLGKSHLCVTRLDSDDSLHQQFIGALDLAITALSKAGQHDTQQSLNFMYGLVEASGQLSVYLRGSNMFQSVYAPNDRSVGAYAIPHDRIRKLMPLVEIITNLPMWMYHRHDEAVDPPGAIARSRLPLPDPALYYPLFGLAPALGAADRSPGLDAYDDRATGAQGHGLESEREPAVQNANLALAMGLPELAFWLSSGSIEAIDPVEVLREIETAEPSFVDSARMAALGQFLELRGYIEEAFRAFDRAIVLSCPDERLVMERARLALAIATRDCSI